ncbi:MAG: hypothetical protein PVG07_03370 [Acidobacteriota bacterium]|jgi:hypothetical protein
MAAHNPRSGRRAHRSRVFTEYVRSLETRDAPPDRESFDRVWNALSIRLRTELRRRGLWTSPPRFLGIVGSESWTEDALEELTAEAYAFNFVDRLRSLQAQLRVKPNVEGLVHLNVRNFLHERQRRHDPLGYRVFEILRAALREAADAGELEVLEGDPRIRNETVLGAAGAPGRPEAADPDDPFTADALDPERAEAWADDLLPDLVTARGRQRDEVVGELRRRLVRHAAERTGPFTVKRVVDPLKAAVRRRWEALHATTVEVEPESSVTTSGPDRVFGEIRSRYRPDEAVETAQAYERLTDCVERLLLGLDPSDPAAEYLGTLWRFLRLHAAGEADLPSRRRLGELLGIPRNRFPELYETLGVLIERCRERLAEPAAAREGRAS